ncbi:sulfotransferase [Arthrobacter sp. Sr24]
MNHNSKIHSSDARGAQMRPNVLMLGGFGRSGSTLLERCLAECVGVTGLGEVLHLWERGLRDNELCGCGLAFHDCVFWQGIGDRAFGGWGAVDSAEAVTDRQDVVRNRHLAELLTGWYPSARRQRARRLMDRVNDLYAAAASGEAELVIDSSKHPAYAYFLRRARIDLKCVLVVRDPRGVAYSWSKVVRRPETGEAEAYMPRYSTVAAVANWSLYSVLFHALTVLRVPVKTVHYEDFMGDPRAVVEDILHFAGHPVNPGDTDFIQPHSVVLGVHHTVAGNPMRMKTGELKIRLDSAWKVEMPAKARRVAGVLTLPLRLVYGQHGQK